MNRCYPEPPLATAVKAARTCTDLLRERFWRASNGAVTTSAPPILRKDDPRLHAAYVEWPQYSYREAGTWLDPIRIGLSSYLTVRTMPTAAPDSGLEALPVTFNLVLGSRAYPVTIDYSDYMDRIYDEQARSSLLYFKMQYRRSGYDSSRIVPGGYVTVSPHFYQYLPAVRRRADRKRYSTDLYGRFTLRFAADIRRRAHQLLTEQRSFRYRGGLTNVRYSRFLLECAEAKICLDLPGNGDFCFRLVDYLAIGCCIIGPKHRTMLPVDLEDRKNIVALRRDLSDLVDVCRYYLAHDAERETIQANARQYFDRYLHREQLAGYMLRRCLEQAEQMEAPVATAYNQHYE